MYRFDAITIFNCFRSKCEEEKITLDNRISEVIKERDAEIQHCEDLKLQLHLAEDKIDSLQTHYNDASRRLKDGNNLFIVFLFALT